MSDHMEPGSIRELFVDDSPAFRVDFLSGPPVSQEQLYWRGPVLWHFDGSAWCREAPCDQFKRKDPEPQRIGRIQGEVDDPIRYEVTMEPSQQYWLFALDTPVTPRGGWIGLERDYTLHRTKPVTRTFTYKMSSDPDYLKNQQVDRWTAGSLALQIPDGRNPRTQEYAQQLLEQFGDDKAGLVAAVLRSFREENYAYSFTPPPLGFHTVDDFLFETREGYCEFYSSAFVFLMRAAGIPARVVTGYLGGEFVGDPQYLLVRQSDAHAWAEVWLEPEGWVRVDPTAAVAPERVDLGALAAAGGQRRGLWDYSWVRDLRSQLDSIHRLWTDWVLKFDQARQRALLSPVGIEEMGIRTAVLLLSGVCFVLLALVMRLLMRSQWLGDLDPAAREYARFCRKLARRGVTRRPSEGPQDFANRASATLAPAGPQINQITADYVALRYGREGDSKDRLRQLRQAVRRLRLGGAKVSTSQA
ncbi:MAG: transglutaminaseTgpA domain-containing protein [Pseudomonadota bacterium]